MIGDVAYTCEIVPKCRFRFSSLRPSAYQDFRQDLLPLNTGHNCYELLTIAHAHDERLSAYTRMNLIQLHKTVSLSIIKNFPFS